MRILFRLCVVSVCLLAIPADAKAQTYGIELHNSFMPASGGMAGASITQPQDVQSALNANPATLTLFDGTQFSFASAYGEATYNLTQLNRLPLADVDPFSGKSNTPGSLLGNIGIVHDVELMGMPIKMGLGFLGNAGLGVDFRPIAASNGTHLSYLALDAVSSVAVRMTPQLSVGGTFGLGTSIIDGPFLGSSSSQTDYAPRFTLGANYWIGGGFSMGAYWQSKKNFNFEDVVRIGATGAYSNVVLDHPENLGFGIANSGLMEGKLLLAVDVLFKNYSQADLFKSLYRDQWAFMAGGQYLMGQRTKLRLGYGYNQNPMLDQVDGTLGGIIPIGDIPAVQYVQGQFAAIGQHRITGGLGVQDVLPNVDMDVFAGGAFQESQTFGSTFVAVESYWIGFGLTWRFGGCGSSCTRQNGCSLVSDGMLDSCTNCLSGF